MNKKQHERLMKELAAAIYHLNNAQMIAENVGYHPEAALCFEAAGNGHKIYDAVTKREKR